MEPNIASIARVFDALNRTPLQYLHDCIEQRLAGANACGSVFADYRDTTELFHGLKTAAWAPYAHPAILKGCTAFRAPFRGFVGVVALADLAPNTTVVLADAKRTGFVEATVRGVERVPVDFAVIILGPDEGREIVYTFHPGPPIAPSQLPAEGNVGRVLLVGDALVFGLTHAKITA